MKPHVASFANAVVLIAVSLWAYLASDNPSATAFIPAAFGALLLGLNPGLKRHNKTIAHIAAGLTLLVLIALVTPLRGAIGRGDTLAIARVSIMMSATAFALSAMVRSFIDARRSRA